MQHAVDQPDDVVHLVLLQAARGDGRGSEAQARGLERRPAVERNHVLVGGDVGGHEALLGQLARQFGELRAQVDEHQVVVRAARDDLVAALDEGGGHGCGVLLHLRLILLVGGFQRFAEGYGLGGDDVLQRTALDAREDGRIEDLRHHLHDALRRGLAPGVLEVLAHQDDAAARAAQGLVGRRGDDMRVFHGVLQQPRGDQTGRVGHVHHQQRAHLVGDLAHAFVIPLARVGRGAADDQFRLALQGLALHGVVVDHARGLVELIAHGLEIFTRHVDRRTVREVSSVCKVQSHERIARLHAGEENGHVGLCARMGLHVGVLRAVETADALDGQRLDLVHDLAAAVVARSGIAFGVFVGQDRTHGLHHLVADEVLRSDQFDAMHLAVALGGNQIENLGISFHIVIRILECCLRSVKISKNAEIRSAGRRLRYFSYICE